MCDVLGSILCTVKKIKTPSLGLKTNSCYYRTDSSSTEPFDIKPMAREAHNSLAILGKLSIKGQ